METKTCISCGKDLEFTKKNFVVRNGKLRNICRVCRATQKRNENERKKARREQELSRVEQRGMDIYAKLAATGGSNIPHSADIVEKIIEYFGGTAGFSAMLVKQFYDSAPGSSVRNKLLETVCRLVQSNVDSGGAKKPLSLWSEEELEEELDKRFKEAMLSTHGLVYGQEAPPSKPARIIHASVDDESSEDGIEEPESRIAGEETGGPEALPADSPAGGDTPLQGE